MFLIIRNFKLVITDLKEFVGKPAAPEKVFGEQQVQLLSRVEAGRLHVLTPS